MTGAPPPTANIPGRNGPISLPGTPLRGTPRSRDSQDHHAPFSASASVPPWQQPSSPLSPSEEFAPNAFTSAPQYAPHTEGPRWYDRFMDVLLGEDETLPKNRLALICTNCRLVNGQAPPGIQRLEDVGRWRCGGCRSMNGEENEAKWLVAGLKQEAAVSHREEKLAKGTRAKEVMEDDVIASEEVAPEQERDGHESDITQYSESLGEEVELLEPKAKTGGLEKQTDTPRRRSARAKPSKGTK